MTHFSDLEALIAAAPKTLAKGAIAMIFIEDQVEVGSTLRHHLNLGFKTLVALCPAYIEIDDDLAPQILRVDADLMAPDAPQSYVNRMIAAYPDRWIYYCFNAEYLFFPFCETRTIGEMLAYTTEERRDSVLCYVIDLYAGDLSRNPSAVALDDAYLDRAGYYALARCDRWKNALDRQMDFFGGLRWRFEEHVPPAKRKIDRIALFKTAAGLTLQGDHTFNQAEYNTYSCPWHNNLTASICSFRMAKALRRNPGSCFDIHSFRWRNSAPFGWTSAELMDLGLMEPGQWF